MSESFVPNMEPMSGISSAFWRFTPILPLVFGYELSYMEQVAKLVEKINEVIENDNGQVANIERLYNAFVDLEKSLMGTGGSWITGEMLKDRCIDNKHLADLCIENWNINPGAVKTSSIHNGSIISEHICDGAVGTAAIADRAVDGDKLAPLSVTNNHLANQSVYGNKIKSGSVQGYHIANSTIAGPNLADNAVLSEKIATGAVTTDKLADGSVTRAKLGELCVGYEQIGKGAVYGTKIQSRGIGGGHIAVESIVTEHLGPNAVTGSKIAVGSVNTDHLADGSVTAQKIGSALKPLVLYSVRDNVYPQNYLNDSTYGDAALDAIMKGKQILVRVPPEKFVTGDFTPEQCASTDAALFSPVVAYHLPNNRYGEYLYLFYLRDEKQAIDLSAAGLPTVYLPVYGQLKMKVSARYLDCPLDGLNGQQYYNILNGRDPNALPLA